ERHRVRRAAGADGDVLLAVDRERDREAADVRPEVHLPEHLARVLIERTEASRDVAAEEEPAAGRDHRRHAGALLALPERAAGLGGDRVYRADAVLAGRDLIARPDRVEVVQRR